VSMPPKRTSTSSSAPTTRLAAGRYRFDRRGYAQARPFQLRKVLAKLRKADPKRNFHEPTIRTLFKRLSDQGRIRKLSKGDRGFILWAASECLASDGGPLATALLPDVPTASEESRGGRLSSGMASTRAFNSASCCSSTALSLPFACSNSAFAANQALGQRAELPGYLETQHADAKGQPHFA
jgi:hypothetical protein